MTVTALPQHAPGPDPAPRRWIPTRAGILNVWRYYDEIFEFHEGRLLLRGPNGSGKSKALELLLPFLFDANLRANRLSTFGTSERTMHWNLMGEGATGVTRVGYVWLEFHLPGTPDRWFTCGARLQATSRTTAVHADYFTTDQRISAPDYSPAALTLTDTHRPLTRAALAERIGSYGAVHDNAEAYRATLRSTLFSSLSEDRYDALITALLQLRTPKLSQRLDPALLSSLLSRALPPLDQDEIADLAEGFERLDAQRERLARLDQEVAATRRLARQQQTYAQRVLRSGAAALSSATTDLEKLADAARASAAEYERIKTLEAETEARVAHSEAELSASEAEREGLMKTSAYEKGLELDDLRRVTAQARTRAAATAETAAELARRAERHSSDEAAALENVDRWERIVADAGMEAGQSAGRAGMVSIHDELASPPDARQARNLLSGAVRAKRDQVEHLTAVITRYENAVLRRDDAEAGLDVARAALRTADVTHAECERAREHALDSLHGDVREWAAACQALSFEDTEALATLVVDRPAFMELVNGAVSETLQAVTRRETRCQNEIETVGARRRELVTECDRLVGEQDIPPEPPKWRTLDRSRLTGAPLWQLIDFAEGVTPEIAAAVEAALEASGLLDAWVGPRGEVVGHDLFADPSAIAPVLGGSLADVLVPVPDTDVASDQVRRLLAGIAFDDRLAAGAVAAVAADGSWRLANLTGTWSKDLPTFIGAATRARARELRIGQLRIEIADCERAIDALRAQLDHLDAQRALVASERANLPSFAPLDAARAQLTRAESELTAADRQVRERIATLHEREDAVRQTQHDLAVRSAETGLPTDRRALRTLLDAVEDFADKAAVWLDTQFELRAARTAADTAAELAAQSAADATTADATAARAEDEYRRAVAELATIEETVGTGVPRSARAHPSGSRAHHRTGRVHPAGQSRADRPRPGTRPAGVPAHHRQPRSRRRRHRARRTRAALPQARERHLPG